MVDALFEELEGQTGAVGDEEVGVDGFGVDAGAGDRVGDDDLFDLRDVLEWSGGDLLVGLGVGDEVG